MKPMMEPQGGSGSSAGASALQPRSVRAFSRQRLGWVDLIFVLAAVGIWMFFPLYMPLAINALVMIILVLGLDLALGWGGIEALGHAAFYGLGAYVAANWAIHVSPEPLSGLAVALCAGAALGALTGITVLKVKGLAQIMLTLTVASLMFEVANSLKRWTGGDDGLTGYDIAPVFGLFEFSLRTSTAYWYAIGVLVVVYLVCRWVVNSPFGLSIRGISENPLRMRMVGVPVTRRLIMLYTISAAIAGLAGGLSAQVTQSVGLDSLSFTVSANAVIMLVLGGAGTLRGAALGAALFVVVSDRAAALDPANWLLGLGLMMMVMVRYAPEGIHGLITQARERMTRRRSEP
jgi:branched-chain amino acid transport system permease protein